VSDQFSELLVRSPSQEIICKIALILNSSSDIFKEKYVKNIIENIEEKEKRKRFEEKKVKLKIKEKTKIELKKITPINPSENLCPPEV
jgi:hypothetical protein